MNGRDNLDVSLVDAELHDELELTTRLIVAVNEAAEPLDQADIDDLLGVRQF